MDRFKLDFTGSEGFEISLLQIYVIWKSESCPRKVTRRELNVGIRKILENVAKFDIFGRNHTLSQFEVSEIIPNRYFWFKMTVIFAAILIQISAIFSAKTLFLKTHLFYVVFDQKSFQMYIRRKSELKIWYFAVEILRFWTLNDNIWFCGFVSLKRQTVAARYP